MKFGFAFLFLCFQFAGGAFSSHPSLSSNFYLLKQLSVPMLSADALLQFGWCILTSVKMIEWHHKEWTLIFEASARFLFWLWKLFHISFFCNHTKNSAFNWFRVNSLNFCFVFELDCLLQNFSQKISRSMQAYLLENFTVYARYITSIWYVRHRKTQLCEGGSVLSESAVLQNNCDWKVASFPFIRSKTSQSTSVPFWFFVFLPMRIYRFSWLEVVIGPYFLAPHTPWFSYI